MRQEIRMSWIPNKGFDVWYICKVACFPCMQLTRAHLFHIIGFLKIWDFVFLLVVKKMKKIMWISKKMNIKTLSSNDNWFQGEGKWIIYVAQILHNGESIMLRRIRYFTFYMYNSCPSYVYDLSFPCPCCI